MYRVFRRALDAAISAAMAVAEIAMALMMLHVVLQIAMRGIFRISIDSVPEIVAFYYMAGMIFLSFAYVTREDGHISASLFTDMLPRRANELLQGLIFVVLAIGMGLFAWETLHEAIRMTRIGEFHQGASINLPKWPTRWFAPIGCGLMALSALVLALDKIVGRPVGMTPSAVTHAAKG
ncbi:TRAP transporter small permease [Pseudotabrizicola sediminis]|nr:TRAP transporter small permease [Pseudotabrizicola sediminis]